MAKQKKTKKANNIIVEKGLAQGLADVEQYQHQITDQNRRGITVYTPSQLLGSTGKDKDGQYQTVQYDNEYFLLTPDDRNRIAQLCTPVLGIVTSRMHRIAGTRFIVTNDKKDEDKIYQSIRNAYNIWKEYSGVLELKYIMIRIRLETQLRQWLPELLPDMSNIESCLIRWKKKTHSIKNDRCDEIYEWLQQPNSNDTWQSFMRKWVFDLMVHGTVPIYKESLENKVENIFILPGGSVMPVRDRFVTSKSMYIQVIDGFEPQIFGPDEISYSQYIPVSHKSYGLVPIEAMINKVAETLLFDKLMAGQADGTKLPEKMIIITDPSPFGNMDKDLQIPINVEEQKRIESKINSPVKGAMMTFSGSSVNVVDLSRENTMGIQMQRQKDIREEVAMVFNMSNMEVNLSGSDSTSGRATSDSQQEIDQGKGIVPVLKLFESQVNREILPFRFGFGYSVEFQTSQDDVEELKKWQLKLQTGLYSVNEIRTQDLSIDPIAGDEFNKPTGSTSAPVGNENNPMFTRSLK